MLTLVLALVAQASNATVQQSPPAKPDIVVTSDKKAMVCTSIKLTGTRVSRGRVCRTKEQAELEDEIRRRSLQEADQQHRIEQAGCGNPMQRSNRC